MKVEPRVGMPGRSGFARWSSRWPSWCRRGSRQVARGLWRHRRGRGGTPYLLAMTTHGEIVVTAERPVGANPTRLLGPGPLPSRVAPAASGVRTCGRAARRPRGQVSSWQSSMGFHGHFVMTVSKSAATLTGSIGATPATGRRRDRTVHRSCGVSPWQRRRAGTRRSVSVRGHGPGVPGLSVRDIQLKHCAH